jgi:hypothetical protein
MSGDMSSVSNLNVSSLSGTDVLNSSISAIGSDTSGSLLEGTLTKATSGIVDTISDNALSSLSKDKLTTLAQSTVNSLGASNYGSDVGGLNLSDMSSRVDALASSMLDRAVTSGNIKASTNMLDVLSESGYSTSMFTEQVKTLGSNTTINPETANTYTELYNKYVPKNTGTTSLGDNANVSLSTFDTTSESSSFYNTKIAENVYGKDEARKRKTLMSMATNKRAASNTSIAFSQRYVKA